MALELLRFPTDLALCDAVAARWLDALEETPRGRPFTVALSGGRVARRLFSTAARLGRERGTDWSGCHFFWGDERCVPPGDAESNFRAAHEDLLQPAGIAATHIHRVEGELPPPEAAARARETLRRWTTPNPAGIPVLDLVFLGMGEDGHVASLFPDTPAPLSESPDLYVPVVGPKPPPQRISLTFPVLAAARSVWVVASGKGKQAALHESLGPSGTTPLAHLLRQRTETLIFTDIDS